MRAKLDEVIRQLRSLDSLTPAPEASTGPPPRPAGVGAPERSASGLAAWGPARPGPASPGGAERRALLETVARGELTPAEAAARLQTSAGEAR